MLVLCLRVRQRFNAPPSTSLFKSSALTAEVPALSMEDARQGQVALDLKEKEIEAQERAAMYAAIGSAIGGASSFAKMCWVARAVLGDDRWVAARTGLLTYGSDELVSMYATYGEGLAEMVKNDSDLREQLRPAFEALAEAGKEVSDVSN